MKKISIILLIIFLGSYAFAQQGSNAYRKHGDTQYKHHHYRSAIAYYTKALKKATDPGNIMLQIAKCYNRINQPVEAEIWFLKANKNKAQFTIQDYYQYARTLVTLNKRSQADALLEHVVGEDPNNHLARKALTDLREFEKYYLDSAKFFVDTLSINTSVAEFAPTYYKDGIVFSSARQEGILRKKYHWDNSHFLNLYVSHQTANKHFTAPELFEKDLNTRFHEGPAMFYDQNRRMILNRNQTVKVVGSEDAYERRLALHDAVLDERKSTWKVTPLPFNDPAYSYAHPDISENGDTLYFVSDQPGGYGGSDIYRVIRKNGLWGKPFNVGPAVNSAENEVFPFFIDSVLYFASNGHGGLGGLDLFESRLTVNGFSPPSNMGYPINTSADDLSLITRSDQRNGYFASARKGNDDLYYFERLEDPKSLVRPVSQQLDMSAKIFRGDDNRPVPNANVKVITFAEEDKDLTSDENGIVDFKLNEGTAFVIVGTKDNLTGMLSEMAERGKTDKATQILPVPLYADKNDVTVIGLVTNTSGDAVSGFKATVTNKVTGDNIPVDIKPGLMTFKGDHGESYNISVSHDDYQTTLQEVILPQNGPDVHKFNVILVGKNDGLKMVLPVATLASTKIADNILAGKSELLVVDTDKGTSKAFILSGVTLSEITQRDNLLYHETPRGNEYLGKGELGDLRRNPSSVLKGVEKTDVTKLRNIYFDFDKWDLDADDEKYLLQVKSIIGRDNTTKLIVAGHADDRGTNDYNIRLSLRRVQSVEDFLVRAGVPTERIVRMAYGESLPVVPCHGEECTEQQHQLNRRAEFVISSDEIIPEKSLPKAGSQ